MIKQTVRNLATQAAGFKIAQPPKFTLASLRTFPSLEPHTFVPVPAKFLDHPLRRDFLWSAVVFEADRARVGSGSGRARVGDANSPSRDNPIKAHGIKAGHDWSTKLPRKVYHKAFQTALSEQYRQGKLFIIGESEELNKEQASETDKTILDFDYDYEYATEKFVETHDLNKLQLLFITDNQRINLVKSTELISEKADVLVKEAVEVRDILKANRVYIEAPALQWFISKYGTE
ncbi:hypothetical protein QCA50_017662 [Cerrena zonata]|uniref:Large ribosomal subunit protein uL4m n=1 Tax=Cerrena zonata TaxID=2478898 RepID=A0AAW0FCR7_9APHY